MLESNLLPRSYQSFLDQEVLLSQGPQMIKSPYALLCADFVPSQKETRSLLLLINGYKRTRLDFRALRKRISEQAPHIATLSFDNRYVGDTVILADDPAFSAASAACDGALLLYLFLNRLHLASCHVLGISLGGMIAQALAAMPLSFSLEHLFLVSTTAGGSLRVWPPGSYPPPPMPREHGSLESFGKDMERYFGEKFLLSSPVLFRALCKNMWLSLEKEKKGVPKDPLNRQYQASTQFDGVAQAEIRGGEGLHEIRIHAKKVSIFSGDEDMVIPVENALQLQQHIPNSNLVVYPGVGHLILMEEAEKFAQDVLQHLV